MNIAEYTEVIWRDGSMSSHESEDAARRKAAKLSKDNGTVYAISYSGATPTRGWTYQEGRGTTIATEELPALAERLQATIPVSGGPVNQEESVGEDTADKEERTANDDGESIATSESENEMATTSKKRSRKAAKKTAAKTTARKAVGKKASKKARATTTPRAAPAPRTAVSNANGTAVRLTMEAVSEAVGSRPETIRYAVLKKLTENPGQPVTMKKLLVAGYGAQNADANRGNLQTVLLGIRQSIAAKNLSLALTRVIVDEEPAYVLKKA